MISDQSKRLSRDLTVELRPASRHEELDGLNLGQVTVLVLLLGVAVRPVVKREQALILPR